jgi:hypothetical protein
MRATPAAVRRPPPPQPAQWQSPLHEGTTIGRVDMRVRGVHRDNEHAIGLESDRQRPAEENR